MCHADVMLKSNQDQTFDDWWYRDVNVDKGSLLVATHALVSLFDVLHKTLLQCQQ